jgi:alkanesulfonate monooxygenase SsuD/methylene tetrahydromethanopterin reductase-like flavin-dependent oxidoreductase (luciferase family)
MKAALFTSVPYMGPTARGLWPVPSGQCDPEVTERSVQASLDQFQLADELGFDWVTVAERRTGFALSNRVLDDTVAQTGYYGRDVDTQRERLQPHDLKERVDLGQMLIGSPATVVAQIQTIQRELGVGILDLVFQPVGREKTLHAIELFGKHVLPRMHQL